MATSDDAGPAIRPYAPADADAVLGINEACVPEVGSADRAHLARLVGWAYAALVAEAGGDVVGFLLGLLDGSDYASPNYRWFASRHPRFAYVDRVAIVEPWRGAGIGPGLYAAFEDAARAADRPVLCAEVNVVPPNPRSLRFHERAGFAVVAETTPDPADPHHRVAMVEKVLR